VHFSYRRGTDSQSMACGCELARASSSSAGGKSRCENVRRESTARRSAAYTTCDGATIRRRSRSSKNRGAIAISTRSSTTLLEISWRTEKTDSQCLQLHRRIVLTNISLHPGIWQALDSQKLGSVLNILTTYAPPIAARVCRSVGLAKPVCDDHFTGVEWQSITSV